MMNVLNQGRDENGKVAPMGATTNSAGKPAGNMVAEISTWSYGTWPQLYYLEGTATGAAASTIYTLGIATPYNRFTLEVAALSATSVDVFASIDGTNFSAVRLVDANTGAVFATTPITATGMYYLDGKYRSIRVDQVGVGASTIRFNHGVV